MKFSLLTSLASLATLSMAQVQLCEQFGYYNSDGYYFNNNKWGQDSGSGDQCLLVFNTEGGGVSWQADWTWSGSENNVKSYPYSGRELQPKLVSQLSSLPTSASWTYEGNNIRANVAYDLFTAADPNRPTDHGDYELMIWYVSLTFSLLAIKKSSRIIGSVVTAACIQLASLSGTSMSLARPGSFGMATIATCVSSPSSLPITAAPSAPT